MTFVQRVQEIKRIKNMTSAELSMRSGVPLGTLNKLLSGAIEDAKLSTAIAIAKGLEVTLSSLIDEGDAALPENEQRLLHDYRRLDEYGRVMVRTVLDLESGRRADADNVTDTVVPAHELREDRLELPLFLASAGRGEEVLEDTGETISVRRTAGTEKADFALRVKGDSMEPRFLNGDILLIHQQPQLNFGELGAFVGDGEGYFKRFMGDRLHSLNPAYADIPICRFSQFICCGKVVGHMKKRSV